MPMRVPTGWVAKIPKKKAIDLLHRKTGKSIGKPRGIYITGGSGRAYFYYAGNDEKGRPFARAPLEVPLDTKVLLELAKTIEAFVEERERTGKS
jgi:hypothetical protein